MSAIEYPVNCPLLDGKPIDEYQCFEIHTVVQGGSPECIAPKEFFKHSNYVDICKNCEFHRND